MTENEMFEQLEKSPWAYGEKEVAALMKAIGRMDVSHLDAALDDLLRNRKAKSRPSVNEVIQAAYAAAAKAKTIAHERDWWKLPAEMHEIQKALRQCRPVSLVDRQSGVLLQVQCIAASPFGEFALRVIDQNTGEDRSKVEVLWPEDLGRFQIETGDSRRPAREIPDAQKQEIKRERTAAERQYEKLLERRREEQRRRESPAPKPMAAAVAGVAEEEGISPW